MPLYALTFDFWNTMVVARTNGQRRQAQRLDHLFHLVRGYRPQVEEEHVKTAFRVAIERYEAAWRSEHRTPTTKELVEGIWTTLDVAVTDQQHRTTVQVFEEGVLHGPPDFAPGLREALAWAARHYRLGIISDTMFSPGHIIRRMLEQRGVLHYFDAFVFSDETGFSKPDVRAFEQASTALEVPMEALIHIGDLRRTDVTGAQEAGARAILFTGVHQDETSAPTPDAVLTHWTALPDTLAHLISSAP